MNTLSFDWATKKAFTYYDPQKDKVKELANRIEAFKEFVESLEEKTICLFEAGGSDTLKLMLYREGHVVGTVPGKKARDFRDEMGYEKSDEKDPKTLYEYYEREKCNCFCEKSTHLLPFPFLQFSEQDSKLAEIKILFRSHEDMKKDMVREKLKLIAFKHKHELINANGSIDKFIQYKNDSIEAKEKDVCLLKKELGEKLKEFPIWNDVLKDQKGIGPVIAAGLLAELGGREFKDDGSLKHYCGMIPKKESYQFNRYVKNILFHFTEGVIKHRVPVYREFYDEMKRYYLEKHPDWRPGKVNNFAKKAVSVKFLLDFWKLYSGKCNFIIEKSRNYMPSPEGK